MLTRLQDVLQTGAQTHIYYPKKLALQAKTPIFASAATKAQ